MSSFRFEGTNTNNGQIVIAVLERLSKPSTEGEILSFMSDSSGIPRAQMKVSLNYTLQGAVRYGYLGCKNRRYYLIEWLKSGQITFEETPRKMQKTSKKRSVGPRKSTRKSLKRQPNSSRGVQSASRRRSVSRRSVGRGSAGRGSAGRRSVSRSSVSRRSVSRRSVSRRSVSRRSVSRRSVSRRSVGRGSAGRRSVSRRSVSRRSVGLRSVGRRSVSRRSVGRRSVGRGSVSRRSVGLRSVGRRSVSRRSASRRSVSRRSVSRGSVSRRSVSRRSVGRGSVSRRSVSRRSLSRGSVSRRSVGRRSVGRRSVSHRSVNRRTPGKIEQKAVQISKKKSTTETAKQQKNTKKDSKKKQLDCQAKTKRNHTVCRQEKLPEVQALELEKQREVEIAEECKAYRSTTAHKQKMTEKKTVQKTLNNTKNLTAGQCKKIRKSYKRSIDGKSQIRAKTGRRQDKLDKEAAVQQKNVNEAKTELECKAKKRKYECEQAEGNAENLAEAIDYVMDNDTSIDKAENMAQPIKKKRRNL